MSNRRVLVVGTTSDYIDILCRRLPGRALFLTDPRERAKAAEPSPDEATELLCDLTRPRDVSAALREHLRRWGLTPGGIACFDDESMALAASLAGELALPYVSPETVAACRSKFLCKQLWRQAGLPCPRVDLVRSAAGAVRFFRRLGRPVVLKPLTGSGSELTFLCHTPEDCAAAFGVVKSGLGDRRGLRMYAPQGRDRDRTDPRRVFTVEEFVEGSEFSCDFLLDGDRLQVIRIARKVIALDQSFGTTLAYLVPADLPPGLEPRRFREQLREAARALGVTRSLCMLDFLVRGDEAVMIEMAPRPGGDCLPPLILQSGGFDILKAAVDFAQRRPVAIPPPRRWRHLVGLRLVATRAGVVSEIDAGALREDRRVLECCLKRGPGHRIDLPPRDYDSRLLGHVIFRPTRPRDLEAECVELAARLKVEMEPAACAIPTTS